MLLSVVFLFSSLLSWVLCCPYHIPDFVNSSEGGGVDGWRDFTAAYFGCGGVWSLRALLTQNSQAECQAGCVWVRERELESSRPAHLRPVPFNPPTQSQLTSYLVPGPNPHILQSSPGHKVPLSPLVSHSPLIPFCTP